MQEALALYFPMLLFNVTSTISESIDNINLGFATSGEIIRDIILSSLLVFGFIVLIMIVAFAADFFASFYSDNYQKAIRKNLFDKFQRVSTHTLEEYGQAKVMPIMMNCSNWMKDYRRRAIQAVIFIPVAILGSFVMMFTLSVNYSLIALASVPIVILFFIWQSRKIAKYFPKSIPAYDEYFHSVKEGITGAKDIRILGKAEERSEIFAKYVSDQQDQNITHNKALNLSPAFNSILFTLITVIIIIYGAHTSMTDAHDLVVLNTILQYILRVQMGSHLVFSWFVAHLPRYRQTLLRVDEVYALPEEVQPEGLRNIPKMAEPSLDLSNVTFKYHNKTTALADINMKIFPNTRVAIAGGSGSGKNMFANLFLQFAQPNEGTISMNGIVISSINPATWRKEAVSYCSANPKFIPATIRDNMKLFNPNVTDEEIMQVFYDLDAKAFLRKFGGNILDFDLGKNMLSDSAKNVLNLVRCILKPANFYIFNQCFEGVRQEYVTRLMTKLRRDKKTCIFITYDSFVCKACNKVYVLKAGRITGEGKHGDLLAYNSDYKKFYASTSGTIIRDEETIEEVITEIEDVETQRTDVVVDLAGAVVTN